MSVPHTNTIPLPTCSMHDCVHVACMLACLLACGVSALWFVCVSCFVMMPCRRRRQRKKWQAASWEPPSQSYNPRGLTTAASFGVTLPAAYSPGGGSLGSSAQASPNTASPSMQANMFAEPPRRSQSPTPFAEWHQSLAPYPVNPNGVSPRDQASAMEAGELSSAGSAQSMGTARTMRRGASVRDPPPAPSSGAAGINLDTVFGPADGGPPLSPGGVLSPNSALSGSSPMTSPESKGSSSLWRLGRSPSSSSGQVSPSPAGPQASAVLEAFRNSRITYRN